MDGKRIHSREALAVGSADVRLVTATQRRYWIDNGYLVLNDAVADVSSLGNALDRMDDAGRRSLLDHLSACRLGQTVEALLGERVVILASRYVSRPWSQPFAQDACTLPGINPGTCVIACVCLATDDATASGYLVPGSHRVAGTAGSVSDPMVGIERLSGWLGRQRSAPEALCLRTGDIWLRHPLLMHGRVETAAANAGRRLEITYLAAGAVPSRVEGQDGDSCLRMSSGASEAADQDCPSSKRKSFASSA